MKTQHLFGLLIFSIIIVAVTVPRPMRAVQKALSASSSMKPAAPADKRPRCFTRQNRLDEQFYLAAFHLDKNGYAWVGHWPSLSLAMQAVKLVGCNWVPDPSEGSTDERPECFERQSENLFYLARINPHGGFAWVGNWDSLTLTLQAADLLHCRMISDPTNGQ